MRAGSSSRGWSTAPIRGRSSISCAGAGNAGGDRADAKRRRKSVFRLNSAADAARVGHIDLLLFSRQMYTPLKSGVPILRALSACRMQRSTPR